MNYYKSISLISLGLLLFLGCETTEVYTSRPRPRPVYVQEPAQATNYPSSNTPNYPPDNSPGQENPNYNSSNQNLQNDDYDEPVAENAGQVNYQSFYDALSPYGDWVQDPYYGYVWVPNVGPNFAPYKTGGHWIYSDIGWTWVSNYSWGWAPFHYGRWKFSNEYGWIWVPGYTWGPAWVAWRSSGSYYGWAPLGPPAPPRDYNRDQGIHISIGLNFSFGDAPEPEHWSFVPATYVASPQINNYYVDRSRNTNIYNTTTVINNVTTVNNITNNYNNNINSNNTQINNSNNTNIIRNSNNVNIQQSGYISGPSRSQVERATGTRISPISIANSTRPGQVGVAGNSLAFYRPIVKPPAPNVQASNSQNSSAPAPRRSTQFNRIVPVYNRTATPDGMVNNTAATAVSSTDQNPVQAARQRVFVKPNRNPTLNNANQNRSNFQGQPSTSPLPTPVKTPETTPPADNRPNYNPRLNNPINPRIVPSSNPPSNPSSGSVNSPSNVQPPPYNPYRSPNQAPINPPSNGQPNPPNNPYRNPNRNTNPDPVNPPSNVQPNPQNNPYRNLNGGFNRDRNKGMVNEASPTQDPYRNQNQRVISPPSNEGNHLASPRTIAPQNQPTLSSPSRNTGQPATNNEDNSFRRNNFQRPKMMIPPLNRPRPNPPVKTNPDAKPKADEKSNIEPKPISKPIDTRNIQ